MHPNFAASDKVSMVIRDLEVVNRLRFASDSRNQRNRRPRTRDDAGADAQLARFDKATIHDVERMLARGLDNFAVAKRQRKRRSITLEGLGNRLEFGLAR